MLRNSVKAFVEGSLSRLTVVSRKAKKKQHARASSGLRDHYSELFTRMAALKFVNAVTQPLLQYHLLNYRPSTFQLSRINNPKLE